MSDIFLVVNKDVYTYDQLLTDINEKTTYSPYIYVEGNKPYHIFLHLIHSLIYDYEVVMVDGDFSQQELIDLGIKYKDLKLEKKIKHLKNISSKQMLVDSIENVRGWKLTLYTSGTTGKPKKVRQSFQNITRNVKKGDRFSNNIWAFAYNPTHIAGLQVFFQALLNLNTVVYVFDCSFERAATNIRRFNITNISATPTFYRNIVPYLRGESYAMMKYITLGGEKYDASLERLLKGIFPNARFRNIYATTETGSLFSSDGETFQILEHLKDKVKISDQNELLIKKDLLGELEGFEPKDDWYVTGDIVKIEDDGRFKFLNRQSEFINVGGYKVNPLEVEGVIEQVSGVKACVVKSRANRVTGEIIVAEVLRLSEVDEKKLKKRIKAYASEHLQEWKVPRIIKFVDSIATTRTGKKVRT